ncbi:hypothetical protein [Roseomonas marmotae]|uniref:Big-1 domain-containing protein n=1 Tax=Roseomonas marmotae TaxID=2768161 RepID=A0ABS3KBM8_9PROT|nr:hypothetical protein [Roseomonas marmotae]MBO1074873.1 hypothetical protein [Roseomonas marmotae]QTI80624.1 hypothetical protein IAI58_07825 [Roseomonas marmotae]
MPFDARNLTPLDSAGGFTMWLYTTTDTRAATLAPGYFASAADKLLPGHLILLQSADALSLIPVRSNGAVGNGLVLDASAPPVRLTVAAALSMIFGLRVSAVQTRAVALDPVPGGLYIGRSFTVTARVTGSVATLLFSILNAAGQVVAGPISASALSGSATATFTAPAEGSGYRIRVQDADEPLVTQTSASFVVTPPFALLTESGGALLLQEGGEMLV